MSTLNGRIQRLEARWGARSPARGILHVWRFPHDTDAEALARWWIDPDAWPSIRMHIWTATLPRLVDKIPRPAWDSGERPPPGALEARLLEAHAQLEARRRERSGQGE